MRQKTRTERWWDFPSAALLLAAMTSVAIRLDATEWTEYLYITELIVILSTIIGLSLGVSRFRAWFATFISILYGLIVVPWQLITLVPKIGPSLTWIDRLFILRDRVYIVLNQLSQRDQVQDSVLFIILMAVLFWVLGIISGYSLTRRGNAWLSLFPAGIVMIFLQSYDPRDSNKIWYLASFIFFGLMLVSRISYIHNNHRWQNSRTSLPPSLGLDFIRFTLITSSAVVLLAWSFPALASALPPVEKMVAPVRQSWGEFQERFDNLFSNLETTINVQTDFYGPSLVLGQGNNLTNEVKFWASPLNLVPKSVRLYWKARTYQAYDGQQWLSIAPVTTEWIPGEEKFPVPQDTGKWKTRFTVISSSFITTLFSPGQPVWIDRDGKIIHLDNPDQTIDIISFQNDPILRPGQDYVVEAELSNPTVQDLKTAGVDYPDWIEERYLQLPPTITERTKNLASDITQGLDTPYDKTIAIIDFLRNPDNYTYQEIIPPPPIDQDVVDWFVFDSRTGFCNYFASAAVVMLRQEGIPARLAVGYATGEKQEDGRYIVRQREAHAWPEVYFPNYGWVEFEPTTSQEPIERLPGTDPNAVDNTPASEAQPFQPPLPQMMDDEDPFDPNAIDQQDEPAFTLSTSQIVILSILGLISLGVLIFYGLKANHIIHPRPLPQIVFALMVKTGLRPPPALKKWADISSLPPLSKAYLEINNALSRLGEHPPLTSTPAERAENLSLILPPAKSAIDKLIHEYQIGFFSTQKPNIIVAYQSAGEIRQQSIRKSMDNLWQNIRNTKLSDIFRKTKKVL